MTTSAHTWFFNTPESNKYLLAERIRTSLWDARFGGIWLDTVRETAPFKMAGTYQNGEVELEWQPRQWLVLRTDPANEDLMRGVGNLLRLQPAFQYVDPRGATTWEWHTGDINERWQTIQGKPEFGMLQRLK